MGMTDMRRLINLIETDQGAVPQAAISQIIRAAHGHGFSGFGGDCGEAAIAINRVIFGGKAEIVGAFNKALFDQGRAIGHFAVAVGDVIWDADGRPKTLDEIESWGMLDPEDSDYAEVAHEAGIDWNDETASEVEIIAFESDQEVLQHCQAGKLDQFVAALKTACEQFVGH